MKGTTMRRPQFTVTWPRNAAATTPTSTPESTVRPDYAQIVRDSAKTVAIYVALGVAGYVVLDTGRQCAVKATPQR